MINAFSDDLTWVDNEWPYFYLKGTLKPKNMTLAKLINPKMDIWKFQYYNFCNLLTIILFITKLSVIIPYINYFFLVMQVGH